jgi:hypothetical protein
MGNHNMLRITRILKCMRHCGLEEQAREFLTCLLGLYAECPREIGAETLAYWKDAVDDSRSDAGQTGR